MVYISGRDKALYIIFNENVDTQYVELKLSVLFLFNLLMSWYKFEMSCCLNKMCKEEYTATPTAITKKICMCLLLFPCWGCKLVQRELRVLWPAQNSNPKPLDYKSVYGIQFYR